MTAPGQTAGLSVFTDPILAELGASRTEVSFSYLIGTLAGAIAQPWIGRALDRWGAREVMVVIGVGFAMILFALSFVGDIFGLTFGYTGVRMAGQGALTLAAATAIAQTVRHRRGLALAITSAIGTAGISLAPVFFEMLIAEVGIHDAWRWQSLAVLVVVVPLALVFRGSRHQRDSRSAAPNTSEIRIIADSWTVAEARRSGMFWILTASAATSGGLTTALAFHQIALLGEQGLTPFEAAANFIPQTVTGIVATLFTGALIDRYNPRIFVIFSMAVLAASMMMLPVVSPGWSSVFYGLALGAAAGSLRGLDAASFVRYFGTAHIGSIRGVATSLGLASTAIGPLLLSLGFDLTGGFTAPALWLGAIPIVVAVLAFFVKDPIRQSQAAQ